MAIAAFLRERIDLVDILRGLALLGMILANFQWLISWDELTNAANAAAVWFVENLISGKFFRPIADQAILQCREKRIWYLP